MSASHFKSLYGCFIQYNTQCVQKITFFPLRDQYAENCFYFFVV